MRTYSPTQINQYLRCPAQWAFRYVYGLKLPPTSSLAQGRSYHKALEHNFLQKIETKEDLPLEDVTDAYATEFDKETTDVEWSPEEYSKGIDNVKGSLKDEGIQLTELAHKELNPKIQPKEVESAFVIEFDNKDYKVQGRIDLVDVDNKIIDHKTSSKKPSALTNTEIIQGAIYCIAKNACMTAFNYVIKSKIPKTHIIPQLIDQSHKEYTLRIIESVDNAIDNQVFYPNRSHVMCSRRHCGYWSICEKNWGGRVKD